MSSKWLPAGLQGSVTAPLGASAVGLSSAMTGVALGGAIASCGIARAFAAYVATGDAISRAHLLCIAAGVVVAIGGLLILLRELQRLPEADNCGRFGRYLVGLTFLLLLLGLWNSMGTCTLALGGGLEFSAAALMESSDPQGIKKAEEQRLEAEQRLQMAQRNLSSLRTAKERSQVEFGDCTARNATANAAGKDAATAMDACAVARRQLWTAEDSLVKGQEEAADAEEALQRGKESCELTRRKARTAQFFLLAVSSTMALFGACFFVVNSVRRMRPNPPGGDSDDAEGFGRDSTPAPANPGTPDLATARDSASPRTQAKEPEGDKPKEELFDSYAFWSGGFFRVGEAMLFTFAFFWLIWTSESAKYVFWLPVVALFVGMFVKTGETVIFGLGMRVLAAAQAFLPLETAPANRVATDKGDASSPSSGGRGKT